MRPGRGAGFPRTPERKVIRAILASMRKSAAPASPSGYTRFTMQGGFYQEVFSAARIDLLVPTEAEQMTIHDKYMNELVYGVFLPETRQELLSIVNLMKERHLRGRNSLCFCASAKLRTSPSSTPTQIHVQAALAELLL